MMVKTGVPLSWSAATTVKPPPFSDSEKAAVSPPPAETMLIGSLTFETVIASAWVSVTVPSVAETTTS